MKLIVKKILNFETRVRDDPLALLEEVEKLTHVPRMGKLTFASAC